MEKYYVNGYTTPTGINSKEEVKRVQASLGVKQDGIWGPQTQAAWKAQSQGSTFAPKPAAAVETAPPRPDYAVSGFTPPAGVTDRQKVRTIQSNLGVKQDGIWGAKTQAAWEKQYGALWQESTPVARQPVTAAQEYAPPKGIDSEAEIRQVQQRLKVTADGTWGRQTQEAWNKMRSPQIQIRPAPVVSQSAPSRASRPSIGPYKTPLVAERTSDAILDRQISSSRLGETEQTLATAFAHSLAGQQKEKLINWINDKGAENTVSGKELPSTVQRLVQETVSVPTEIKTSKELERSSPFRPHIESVKAAVPGITFSNYYFDAQKRKLLC